MRCWCLVCLQVIWFEFVVYVGVLDASVVGLIVDSIVVGGVYIGVVSCLRCGKLVLLLMLDCVLLWMWWF